MGGKIIWTKDQEDAIYADGGRLLVSAAAGSGKTAVLVERVIKKLSNPYNPIMADKLLVATFSNAAATEMLEKIERALSNLIIEESKNKEANSWLLHRQRILLNQASISTVHSFCLKLIRENFHLLDISSDFRIGDQSEITLLKQEAIGNVLEKHYGENNKNFLNLVELVSDGRDDRKLEEIIFQIHTFISAHPFPKKWMDEKLKDYNPSIEVEDTSWGKIMLEYGKEGINHLINICAEAINIINSDKNIVNAYFDAFNEVEKQLNHINVVIQNGEWGEIVTTVNKFTFPRLGSLRGYSDSLEREVIKNIQEEIKTTMKDMVEKIFFINNTEHKNDMEMLNPKITMLFKVVNDFSNEFYISKQRVNILDFSDLEHLTLMLLLDIEENGVYKKSKIAEELSEKYEMILVDEYQDTNEVQDLIFKTISKDEKNIFMVGDVKQSIYSFRQAMPEIFLNKKRTSTLYNRNNISFPANINLAKNFRSRKEVCNGINLIFEKLMSEDVGGIIYDESEKLVVGSSYPKNKEAKTTIITVSAEDKERTVYEQESEIIAEKITEMIDSGYLVKGNNTDEMRQCRYEDFTILLRSRTHITTYEKNLEKVGIPTWTDFSESFFTSKEVMYVISFLNVIDNPLLDIDIASVMMSPMFNFTPNEMAKFRMKGKEPIYILLQKKEFKNNEKINDFLNILNKLRTFSISSTVDRLIQKIFEKTYFDLYVRAMKNGNLRLFNLHLLINQAKDYENAGYRGLSGFNRLILKMMEEKLDISRDMSLPIGENVVKIMTMHRSKGLEFPIVFIAGTNQGFNLMDIRKQTLLHSDLGFACKQKELNSLKTYPTLPYEALKVVMKKDSLSEEMRVLYVALTRAKESLFIMCSDRNLEGRVSTLAAKSTDSKPSSFTVLGINRFSDWILLSILNTPPSNILREKYALNLIQPDENHNFLNIQYYKTEKLDGQEKTKIEKEFIALKDEKLEKELEKRINYIYTSQELTTKPSKLAVSEIAEKDVTEGKTYLKRPQFMYGQGLSPAEKGNAHHTFMQFANYESARENPKEELELLLNKNYLTSEEAEAIEVEKIKAFFNSNVAKRMFKSKDVKRELKFIVAMEENNEESTMIQGIVDCVFIEDDELIILDYKTDRVKTEKELINRYEKQLSIYSKALEESSGKKIKEKIIYSFHLNKSIIV